MRVRPTMASSTAAGGAAGHWLQETAARVDRQEHRTQVVGPPRFRQQEGLVLRKVLKHESHRVAEVAVQTKGLDPIQADPQGDWTQFATLLAGWHRARLSVKPARFEPQEGMRIIEGRPVQARFVHCTSESSGTGACWWEHGGRRASRTGGGNGCGACGRYVYTWALPLRTCDAEPLAGNSPVCPCVLRQPVFSVSEKSATQGKMRGVHVRVPSGKLSGDRAVPRGCRAAVHHSVLGLSFAAPPGAGGVGAERKAGADMQAVRGCVLLVEGRIQGPPSAVS